MSASSVIELALADEAATIRLGEDLALALKRRDCLALYGDLGAGKSTLARALIRALADDDDLDVPSPTFTLVQSYEELRLAVAHFDLYRLSDASELAELGLDEALVEGIAIIEWPDKGGGLLPADRISLHLTEDGAGRRAMIAGPESAMQRIARSLSIRAFLDAHGYSGARRRFHTGDASTRAYETIAPVENAQSLILMDWPKPPSGPPVLNGKPYTQIAHIATEVAPFIAIAGYLRRIGLAAPAIHAADGDHGLLLMEDLGREGVLDRQGRPIEARYRTAAACLAHLHGQVLLRDLPAGAGRAYRVPDFDSDAILIETRLLIDWYLPFERGTEATEAERQDYLAIWQGLIARVETAEKHLLLRDVHSPNLIWRERETGFTRIGLIDFQDAMIGPTAYDLASLAQDARADMPPDLSEILISDYVALRRAQGDFDEQGFRLALAIMAAQRNCKLIGIWVRLKERDGKPGYMRHMPRTLGYLSQALRHEALAPLREWCLRAGIELTES